MNDNNNDSDVAFQIWRPCRKVCTRWTLLLCRFSITLVCLTALSLAAADNSSQTNNVSAQLAEMSIEQLADVNVVSVNSLFKKETRLEQAPAAAYIVNPDDISRLGITALPEALRLVPGMDVAQIDSHEWAISARGFNAQFANKLLILMDGRTIYGPAYGGVNWGMQDTVLEDLDRIEVIRGPGASLWGANAVNGVVNILTKSSKDTQGWLTTAYAGTLYQPSFTVRYGGQLSSNLYYRVWGKYIDGDSLTLTNGNSADDSWNSFQTGMRMDWEPGTDNKATLQGNYYNDLVHENQNAVLLVPPYDTYTNVQNHDYGGNVLGRWTHDFSQLSTLSLQVYYDFFKQEQVGTSETRHTVDFDGSDRFQVGMRNDIIWGLGYHFTTDDFPPNFYLTWTPPSQQYHVYSAFVQDEITVVPERFNVTVGSKFEHNDYTGFEFEPNIRALWTPSEQQTVWAAVSRAIRTPSRYETGARVNYSVSPIPSPPYTTPLGLVSLFGNPDAQSEKLVSYELGYRIEPTKKLSFDLATFYNQYTDLLRFVSNTSFIQFPITVFPQKIQNDGSAETWGAELSAEWKVMDNWRLTGSYSWLQVNLHPNDPSFQGNPEQQVQLRSYLDLPWNTEFNGAVYYVDQQTAAAGLGTVTIPSYVRLDLGLVWHPTKSLEIGIWGQNLTDGHHVEFPSLKSPVETEIPRSILGKISLRF